MSKLTYNPIQGKVEWDCPYCGFINSFDRNKVLSELICGQCGKTIPLDPRRYEQFEALDEAIIKTLSSLVFAEK